MNNEKNLDDIAIVEPVNKCKCYTCLFDLTNDNPVCDSCKKYSNYKEKQIKIDMGNNCNNCKILLKYKKEKGIGLPDNCSKCKKVKEAKNE